MEDEMDFNLRIVLAGRNDTHIRSAGTGSSNGVVERVRHVHRAGEAYRFRRPVQNLFGVSLKKFPLLFGENGRGKTTKTNGRTE